MGRVRGKDTKPELLVRRILHRNGYRFRLHAKVLPGKPDIVLAKHRTVVLVHGCFWHRHKGCSDATVPKSRTDFWIQKFTDNVKRDARNQAVLRKLGWTIIIVWECETAKLDRLSDRLRREIEDHRAGCFLDESMVSAARAVKVGGANPHLPS